MRIENPIKLTDDFLRLQTAKIKNKINDDEKYLSLLKKTSFWNSDGEWLSINVLGENCISYTNNIGSTTQSISNAINIFLNPVLGIIQYGYFSISNSANEQMLHKYETDNKSDNNTMLISSNMERFKKNDKLTRLSNVGLGLFYIATPIIESINTKSVSFESVNDFIMGSGFLSTGLSQYLRHSDNKGLKRKQEEKELKGLEKLMLHKI